MWIWRKLKNWKLLKLKIEKWTLLIIERNWELKFWNWILKKLKIENQKELKKLKSENWIWKLKFVIEIEI